MEATRARFSVIWHGPRGSCSTADCCWGLLHAGLSSTPYLKADLTRWGRYTFCLSWRASLSELRLPGKSRHLLGLQDLQAENRFYICKWVEKIKRRINILWILCRIQISLSVSKVLLGHSHAVCGGFHAVMAKLSDGQTDPVACKMFTIWSLSENVCWPLTQNVRLTKTG